MQGMNITNITSLREGDRGLDVMDRRYDPQGTCVGFMLCLVH